MVKIYYNKFFVLFIIISLIFLNLYTIVIGIDTKSNSSDNNSYHYYSSPKPRYQQSQIDLKYISNSEYETLKIYGPDSNDGLGEKVVLASGDINGDGYDDIILGVRYGDGFNNMNNNCGEVHIILGKNNLPANKDLATNPGDIIIYGAEDYDYAGSVATGDINGDKIDDIIIGASGGDGIGNSKNNCGEVYIIFGNNSIPARINLSSQADVTIYGVDDFDISGLVITSGEVNGDNFDDVIIGVYNGDGPPGEFKSIAGEVYVILGNTSLPSIIHPLSYSNALVYYGNDESDYFGGAIATGDVNGDSIHDLIIGAGGSRGINNTAWSCGEAYILYGNKTLKSSKNITYVADIILYGPEGQDDYTGSSVGSGDINGDGIFDIIIGASRYDGPSNRLNCGVVYIIYGSSSLSSILNLTSKSDIIIYGADTGDRIGSKTVSRDLNLDGYSDVLIGTNYADGPSNNRIRAGEVYIIYGESSLSSAIDLTDQYDIVIYGADADDKLISIAVGDINCDSINDTIIGAGSADGPSNGREDCGEAYVIFGKTIIDQEFNLIDGDGNKKNICYAKYKPYTFQVKVTDYKSLNDLKNVLLILDPDGTNLQYRWSRTDDSFTTEKSPDNYTTLLTSASSAINDGDKNWTIDFKVIFNWSYPSENLSNCQINIESYSLKNKIYVRYFDIYKVENDLDFEGNLIVNGGYQKSLSKGDWIRGGEQITWKGLKVIYENDTTVFPPEDSGVTITVWDDDGDSWSECIDPGENISIITTADNETNLDEIYTLNITGVPSECDKSKVTFELRIDGDNVTFSNPSPYQDQWQTTVNPQCRLTISDQTTKVNASSIQYQISTDNGTTWGDWTNIGNQQIQNEKSINCTVKPILKDGRDNLIRWHAKDIVNNGYTESDEYRILIDVSNVTFINATPSSDEWQTSISVVCNITVIDNLSGVNASSIEFSYSTAGIWGYNDWQSARQLIDGNKIPCSVTPIFEEGEENYIKYRAKDVVENGPYVSEDYQIRIKLNHPPSTNLLLPKNNSIIKPLTPELIWEGTDIDSDSPIYYTIYLSNDKNEVINRDPSVHIISNFIDTRYKMDLPLIDGSTYYWTVIPNDAIINGVCKSNIWQFKIDISVEIPVVTLIAPTNNLNVSSTTPTLSWNVKYYDINIITYDIFLDNSSDPKNVIDESYKETSFTPLNPLTPKETYYWTVIPTAHTDDGKIEGICESNIWSFTIEVGFAHIYGVDIKLESENLIVKQDDYVFMNITIKNTGNSVDMISLHLDKGILNANVALDYLDTPIRLNSSEDITLKLQIMTFEDTKIQNYSLTITAVSNNALSNNKIISDKEIINLKVIQKEIIEDKDQKVANLIMWVTLIIIIIIIINISIFLLRKRKAKKIPTVKAELLHVPPKQIALPGETPSIVGVKPLLTQPTVSVQLSAPVSSLVPTPVTTQYQLPKATLTKAQKLGLLQERFLKGEVDLETYKKLRAEIEGSPGEDIIKEELKERPPISEQQQPEPIEVPTKLEESSGITPEPVGKPPQQQQTTQQNKKQE